MITVNELRTGNLLNYKTSEGEILPTKIDWQDLKWLTENPNGFNNAHTPILLTEKWLLKFGFESKDTNYDGGHHFYQLAKDSIIFSTPFECDSEVELDGVEMNIKIEYVHQLQNLYFALTGEELTIKI